MRSSFMAILSLLVAAPVAVQAQQPASVQDEIRMTREEIARNRQDIVRAAMKLDSAQAEKFWPTYRAYKSEQEKIGDRQWKALTAFGANYDKLDEATSKTVLDEWLAANADRAKLANKYRGKFEKAIGAKQTLRFYQVEGKLDHLIQGEVVSQIPLAK